MNDSFLIKTVEEYPFIVKTGNGICLLDKDFNQYFDLWNDEGVNSLGYCYYIPHSHIPFHIPKMYGGNKREVLAEMLVNTVDSYKNWKVMFHNSGTEANEAAIKIARKYNYDNGNSKVDNILSFTGQFHGRTYGSLSAGDEKLSPHHYAGFGLMLEGFRNIDPNVESIKEYITKYYDGRLAAIIIAPICGNNDIIVYDRDFYIELMELKKATGALLIFDEIQVGCGRTVKNFWSFQTINKVLNVNLQPDIITFGKGIAAGLPLSGIIVKNEIAESFTLGSHFNTTGGSELACLLGMCVVNYINYNNDYMGLLEKHMLKLKYIPYVSKITGIGIHIAIHIKYDELGCDSFEVCKMAFKNKLLIVSHKQFGPIRFFPTLNCNDHDLNLSIELFRKTIEELAVHK